MIEQYSLSIHTKGRGFYEVTHLINEYVTKSRCSKGVCSLFLSHTSASLILCENADDKVKEDLENFFSNLIPDDPKLYQHIAEGKDDMPAHIRTILTNCDLTLPILDCKLGLGTWQGIFLWEHRLAPSQRHLILTIMG